MLESKQEKIIAKIRKILELSKKNPNQNEAQSAALKAQALMAEYHVQLTDLEDLQDATAEDITEEVYQTGTGNKWKYSLARIIARNFRCKHFYYGKSAVAFYGYETDVKIACMTFEYLFTVGKKAMNTYYMNKRNEYIRNGGCSYTDWYGKNHSYFDGSGLKNSFIAGFLEGIREVLDQQCTALLIVTPPEVIDSYDKMAKEQNFSTMKTSGLRTRCGSSGREARESGRIAGKNAVQNRQLECVC